MPEAKPYSIPKQLVWEAYQRVKANRGAAGVDGESLAAFEKDLKELGSYQVIPVGSVDFASNNLEKTANRESGAGSRK